MICYWRCRRDVIHVSTSPDYTTHHVTTWRSDCCSAGSYCDSCVTSMTLLPFLIVSSAFKDLPFSPLPVFFSLTLASSSSLASTFIILSLLPPCCRRLSLSLSLSLPPVHISILFRSSQSKQGGCGCLLLWFEPAGVRHPSMAQRFIHQGVITQTGTHSHRLTRKFSAKSPPISAGRD